MDPFNVRLGPAASPVKGIKKKKKRPSSHIRWEFGTFRYSLNHLKGQIEWFWGVKEGTFPLL